MHLNNVHTSPVVETKMKSGRVIVVIILCICIMYTQAQWWRPKCRALILEGGGDKGAYQVGGIRGLVENLSPSEVQYDVVSGISIGAINAVAMSLFKQGKEDEASKWLVEFWEKLNADSIYSNWPGYIVEGAFWRSGLYNNSKFVDFLHENVPMRTIYRKVSVGATNAKNGAFTRFNETLGVEDLMFKAVAASSAFPGFFQSVNFKNNTYIDGGVLINLDIAGAIERCKEKVYRDSDIIIDIVMCSGDILTDVDVEKFNAIQMMRRYFQISDYQKTMSWITHGKANFPEVNFRYIVHPIGPISKEWLPMGFYPQEIRKMIEHGRQDARKSVQMGEGKMFNHLVNFWNKVSENSEDNQTFDKYLSSVLSE